MCIFLQFSIKITEESMYNYQLLPSIQSYLSAFDRLLASSKSSSSEKVVTSHFFKFRGEVSKYSDDDARDVLCKLFERNKSNVQKKNWKVQQTNLLCYVVDKYQNAYGIKNEQLAEIDWNMISECIPHREASACRFRYLSLTSPNITHKPWSQAESQTLFRLVQPIYLESINWKKISQKLYDSCQQKIYRTGKQCREHYTCFLRPNLKKGQWTSDQDYIMICLFLKYGKKWSKMTKFIEGRNQNSIKNRFFLIFENKVKVKLSNSDLVKLAKRKKEKLEKTITSSTTQTITEQMQSFVEMPQVAEHQQSQYHFNKQSEHRNYQEDENSPQTTQIQQVKIEEEQKCEVDFTEDYQKYIDL